jgi:cobalt/nickel transport system permease protein
MHIPDGYLGPLTYGGLWAAMAPSWLYASRRVRREVTSTHVPYLAMASAFCLAVMVVAFPLPGGTTGHLAGSGLVAVLLGPWACVLAISVALGIQALVFGDGGITALAANCFNMGLAAGLCAHWVYRLFSGPKGTRRVGTIQAVGAGLAGYVGINVAALLTALELGIQPLISHGSPQARYFPYGLEVTLPAVMIPHLTVLGAMEAAMTAIVVGFVRRLKVLPVVLLGTFLLATPEKSNAHEFWIEGKGEEFLLVFGHGTNRADFDPSNVKAIKAWGAKGEEIPVTAEKRERALQLRPAGEACVIYSEIDNGYWCKTIYGWKNVGKSKASRVVEALKSLNYAKKIICGGDVATRGVEGTILDIVPTLDPSGLKKGDGLTLRVLFRGKPLPGAEVSGGDHQKIGTTDPEGIVKVQIGDGSNLIAVTTKQRLDGDPEADFLSITATLSLEVGR